MNFEEAEGYIGKLTNTQPWMIDSTKHLRQIFAVPETLHSISKNKNQITEFAKSLPKGSIRMMGKGDKASNAEVIAAYARLFDIDVEYSDFITPGVKTIDAFIACSYSGKTGDLIHRMKKIKSLSNAKLFGITNKFSPDTAPAGTIYDICENVLYQELPRDEDTIVSSMSSYGVTFAGIATMDVLANGSDKIFEVMDILSERVKQQLASHSFWDESFKLAQILKKRPSYWFASDLYLGAAQKININLREQSGLYVSSGLIDDFSHREIGLVDGEGATLILINTPDIEDKENFSRSREMIRQMARKSDNLELIELDFKGSFIENVSDIYLKILGAGYMASMLGELDPNAARNFIDKVRSY